MTDHEPTPTTIDDDALEPAPPPADPRRTTTHVVRKGRRLPGQSAFLAWPAASSLLFLLSAACLLGGAWTVFASLGIDPDRIGERLGMVGTVHLYELALVAVALLLCRFQRANPDAIGPVLLGACFLVGSAVTLDLVSIDAPWLALACGATGLALAFAKGRVLAHLGGGAGNAMLLVPLALLMTWNLLWPGVMGLYLKHSASGLASTAWWIPGWTVLLLGTAALVIGVIRDDGVGVERLRPFLRRTALRWVLGLAIAGCSALHLLVLGYVHSLDVTLGEILPLIALLCLGAVDLRHRAGGRAPAIDRALLALPGVLALVTVLTEEHGVMSNPQDAGLVFTPALVLLGHALALWRLAGHRLQHEWRWLAAGSAALGVLLWGAQAEVVSFNWSVTALAIALALALRALLARRAEPLAKALALAVVIVLIHPDVVRWEFAHGLSPVGSVLVAVGAVVLTVALLMPAGLRAGVPRLALWLLTVGVLDLCGRHGVASPAALGGAVVLGLVHGLAFSRTRDAWGLVPLLLPALALAPGLAPANKGWLAVWAAFALLAVGVGVSWCRVRALRHARGTTTPARPLTPVPLSAAQGVLE